jgi:hypothetical protein
MWLILAEGPSSPSEWWLYEVLTYLRGDASSLSLTFDGPALWLAFSLLGTSFAVSTTFFTGIFNVVTMLPIKNKETIEKKMLFDLVIEVARQCGMKWWCELRERLAVFIGVLLAGMILRRVGSNNNKKDMELEMLMGKVDLGIVEDNEVMRRLGEALEGVLKISD